MFIDKCLLKCIEYFTTNYTITKDECITIYNNVLNCVIYSDKGERCKRKVFKDRLCKIHYKQMTKNIEK